MANERKPRRVLIVFDGEAWFVRRVRLIEHDGVRDEKVYRCDKPISGPHLSLANAADEAITYVLRRRSNA